MKRLSVFFVIALWMVNSVEPSSYEYFSRAIEEHNALHVTSDHTVSEGCVEHYIELLSSIVSGAELIKFEGAITLMGELSVSRKRIATSLKKSIYASELIKELDKILVSGSARKDSVLFSLRYLLETVLDFHFQPHQGVSGEFLAFASIWQVASFVDKLLPLFYETEDLMSESEIINSYEWFSLLFVYLAHSAVKFKSSDQALLDLAGTVSRSYSRCFVGRAVDFLTTERLGNRGGQAMRWLLSAQFHILNALCLQGKEEMSSARGGFVKEMCEVHRQHSSRILAYLTRFMGINQNMSEFEMGRRSLDYFLKINQCLVRLVDTLQPSERVGLKDGLLGLYERDLDKITDLVERCQAFARVNKDFNIDGLMQQKDLLAAHMRHLKISVNYRRHSQRRLQEA